MEEYIFISLLTSFATALVISIITSSIISKRKKVKKLNKLLTKGGKLKDPADLVDIVAELYEKNNRIAEETENKLSRIQWKNSKSIKKIAYERYDATDDIGGQMSFSVAFLNEEDSGILLTNLYMGDGTFLYLREITNGKSQTNISDTEKSVIQKAMNSI